MGEESSDQMQQRRMALRKKLRKIRLNQSYRNNSFSDMVTVYEAKLKKMRGNNMSLAKALADQRQVSQSWYEEVVNLKGELQHANESLLSQRYAQSGNYGNAIKSEVNHKIRELCEPMEALIKECLPGVLGLVENFTKLQSHISTVRSNSSTTQLLLNTSARNSISGCHPPLSRSVKTPRRNVVRPMIEGHVLQMPTINLARLEDQRLVRLSARGDGLDMEVIDEGGSSSEEIEEVFLPTSPPSEEDEGVELRENEAEPSHIEAPPTISEVIVQTVTPKTPVLYCNSEEGEEGAKNIDIKNNTLEVDVEVDPLEGPSWLYKRNGRGRPRGRKRKGVRVPKKTKDRRYNAHLGLYSDSESDYESDVDEYLPPPPRFFKEVNCRSASKPKPTSPGEVSPPNPEPPSNNMVMSPIISLIPLDAPHYHSKVGRRRKKCSGSTSSQGTFERFKSTEPVPLDSFILKDDMQEFNHREDLKENVDQAPPSIDTCSVVTMDITQCVKTESLMDELPNTSHTYISNGPDKRKFFGIEEIKNSTNVKLTERTPFDISQMDMTESIHPYLAKSNLPSVIVTDIMKNTKDLNYEIKLETEDNDKENALPECDVTYQNLKTDGFVIRKSKRVHKSKLPDDFFISPKEKKRCSSKIKDVLTPKKKSPKASKKNTSNKLLDPTEIPSTDDTDVWFLGEVTPSKGRRGNKRKNIKIETVPIEIDPLAIEEEVEGEEDPLACSASGPLVEMEPPEVNCRRRRTAPMSFKEPSLNRKLRQGDTNSSSVYKNFIPGNRKPSGAASSASSKCKR